MANYNFEGILTLLDAIVKGSILSKLNLLLMFFSNFGLSQGCCRDCSCSSVAQISRRRWLQFLLTSNIAFFSWLRSSSNVYGAPNVEALVLTCIDYRFVSIEQNFLEQQNLGGKYDWLSLAGASLALTDFPSAADTETFWEQLELSISLHQIKKVIIVDHQDCGAYGAKIDSQLSQNPEREKQIHLQYLKSAQEAIKQRYPFLQVELYFAHLNGQVEIMAI